MPPTMRDADCWRVCQFARPYCRSHAVVIVDAERRIIGLITQTDLLAAAARVHMADTTLAAA
ncbi:hypothetical protein [Mesorhizobium sp. M1329]|uniref:hypothetical protein n=1 Tax=Mesorhizobium sp. M1329 TaxID=2957083 RepID=UPI00333ADC2D